MEGMGVWQDNLGVWGLEDRAGRRLTGLGGV